MAKIWLAAVLAAVMVVWAAPASAVVIFDNGGPSGVIAYYSDPVNHIFVAYDDFTLGSTTTITDAEWWGIYAFANVPPATDNFFYSVRQSPGGGGQPGLEIASGGIGGVVRTDTGMTDSMSGGLDIYKYHTDSLSILLPAGTYYISFFDTAPNSSAFAWETSNASVGDEWSYDAVEDFWGPASAELAFNLSSEFDGVIPEPATMTLIGLGLAGLIGRQIRRRAV